MLDVLAVLDPGGEDQHRPPVCGALDDLFAGGPYERVGVHQGLDFARDELAASEVQACRVGLDPARLAP